MPIKTNANSSSGLIASSPRRKTLVIMGTHWKGLKYFDWARHDCDIWMFNEAPNVKFNGKPVYPRTDAVFQLHHEAIWKNPKNRSDEKHYEWLKSGDTPSIYMQKHYSEVPKSIEYPIEEILALTKNVKIMIDGKEESFKYFSSSPEYALALAADMYKKGKGYKRVEVWGIELEHESEYIYQRTGFAFWTGYLAALGVDLILANSIFDAPMYGYEGDLPISSKFLEERIALLDKQLGTDKERYNQEVQELLANISNLLVKDISKDIEKEMNDLTKRNETTAILNGQVKESKTYLEKARAMEGASGGSSIFSLGEFDSTRHQLNHEYSKVREEANSLNAQIGLNLKRLLILKKGSHKRQRAIDEFTNLIAQLLNKNILLLHIIGAIKENQYYIDFAKINLKASGGGK